MPVYKDTYQKVYKRGKEMRKILIATHGDFASGAVSAASIIAGEKDYVTYINAYTDSKNLKVAIEEYFKDIKEQDELIILTDLFGGSVNQALMPYVKQDNIYIITGFNLALLLEILMLNELSPINMTQLRSIVEDSKSQTMLVNDVIKASCEDDFD